MCGTSTEHRAVLSIIDGVPNFCAFFYARGFEIPVAGVEDVVEVLGVKVGCGDGDLKDGFSVHPATIASIG